MAPKGAGCLILAELITNGQRGVLNLRNRTGYGLAS